MNFFEGDLIHPTAMGAYKAANTVEPDINLYDLGHEFIAKIEMPGLVEDVKMKILNGELIITAIKSINCGSAKPILSECKACHFKREITLPKGTTIDMLATEYADGVFTIHIPKTG